MKFPVRGTAHSWAPEGFEAERHTGMIALRSRVPCLSLKLPA
jgi:hypothetical protein